MLPSNPLMESYKNQIADLKSENLVRAQEINAVKFELEQSPMKLRITVEERTKNSEMLELYQERHHVCELELLSHQPISSLHIQKPSECEFTEAELLGTNGHNATFGQPYKTWTWRELNDAITGTTMTDLKLQV